MATEEHNDPQSGFLLPSQMLPMTVPVQALPGHLPPVPVRLTKSFPDLLASFRLIDEDDITPEEVEGRAFAEIDIHNRIFRLRQQGMLFGRPLIKRPEPVPKKVHWDYLLQEMAIVAEEMSKERRQKGILSRKHSRAVARYFEIEQEKESRSEREEEKRLRKIASGLARDVLRFWKKIEKVLNLKKESKMKEIQSAAMDKHLDFIVGETEKYSVLLAEKLGGGVDPSVFEEHVSRQEQGQGKGKEVLRQETPSSIEMSAQGNDSEGKGGRNNNEHDDLDDDVHLATIVHEPLQSAETLDQPCKNLWTPLFLFFTFLDLEFYFLIICQPLQPTPPLWMMVILNLSPLLSTRMTMRRLLNKRRRQERERRPTKMSWTSWPRMLTFRLSSSWLNTG